ncbi:NHL repeat-containing protein [candidate division KSB1 bacterium]|nr:NHL repeat-containing protein [candidate division KSB1 bacterium]
MFIRFTLLLIMAQVSLTAGVQAQERADSISAHFVYAFGAEGDKPGEFRQPMGIDIDANGNVYVVDTGNHRVQRFNNKGVFLSMIGGFGWSREQLQRPMDVCASNGLDVFVADYENRRIERFDKDLHWISTYQSNPETEEKLTLGFPQSIALSRHGDLFVVDAENRRILKLNTLREAEMSFGDYDWGEGALLSPAQIEISLDDRIFVADQNAGRVMVYDYFGNYIQTIGQGVLKEPRGICMNPAGSLICVTDPVQDQVFVFTVAGRRLCAIGGLGSKFGALDNPTDVALHKNLLFITEGNNHRVQVFELQFEARP